MMWGYNGVWSWGGMLLMSVSMIALLALLGAIIFWVTRSHNITPGAGRGTAVALTAPQLLAQRYAQGEIDEATFQRMNDQLDNSSTQ